jgi:hypothetical protein
MQLFIDEPYQYFFNFDWVQSKAPKTDKKYGWTRDMLDNTGLTGMNKVHVFPLSKNSVRIRFENIFDKFDCQFKEYPDYCYAEQIQYIDVKLFS